MVATKPVDGIRCSIDQRIANGELDRRGEIGGIPKIEAAPVCDHLAYRRFQSREREVATWPALEWPGQDKTVGVTLASGAFDRGTAGIAEPDQFRGLVECLPGRVIECRAEAGVTPDASA